MTGDKAGRRYWDKQWASAHGREWHDRGTLGLRGHLRRAFQTYFDAQFSHLRLRETKLLEIGCAGSIWLPYFASEFGFSVSGIDYSAEGCEQSRHILKKSGINGHIVCEDFFNPPADMLGAFDVVVSFGVVEHFEHTEDCIRAISRFLKRGGILLTSVPNMNGLIGIVQRLLNRPIYDIHVPLDTGDLAVAHEACDLEIIHCNYFMSTNFGVCNLIGLPRSLGYGMRRALLTALKGATAVTWMIEDTFRPFPRNRVTSPYVNCLARKRRD